MAYMRLEMAEVSRVRITFQAWGTKEVVEQIVARLPTMLAASMAGSGAVGQAPNIAGRRRVPGGAPAY